MAFLLLSGFGEDSVFLPKYWQLKEKKTFGRLSWGYWIYLDWKESGVPGCVFRIALSNLSSHLLLLDTLIILAEKWWCLSFQRLSKHFRIGPGSLLPPITMSSYALFPHRISWYNHMSSHTYLCSWCLASCGKGLWHCCHCRHVLIFGKVGITKQYSIFNLFLCLCWYSPNIQGPP